MKAKFILIIVALFFTLDPTLRASLDSLAWTSDRLSTFKDFDGAKHDGLVCDIDEVKKASIDPLFSKVKYLRIKCGKESFGESVHILYGFRDIRVIVLLECKIELGDLSKILLSAPNLRSLVLVKANVVNFDWPNLNNSVNELWVTSESIIEIPPSLMNDKKIEKLIMSNCALGNLRGDLSGMSSLKMAYLDHCGIRTIDPSFKLPRSIEFIQLGFNNLAAVPEFISNLPNLKYIDLMSNKIHRIPAWLDDAMDGTALEVNLASNNIKYVPDFVWNYAGRVHLADNAFSENRQEKQ